MRAESGLRQVDAAFARAGVTPALPSTRHLLTPWSGLSLLGFGPALVPRSAAARPDDVVMVGLADPKPRHPISLVHRHPEHQRPGLPGPARGLRNAG